MRAYITALFALSLLLASCGGKTTSQSATTEPAGQLKFDTVHGEQMLIVVQRDSRGQQGVVVTFMQYPLRPNGTKVTIASDLYDPFWVQYRGLKGGDIVKFAHGPGAKLGTSNPANELMPVKIEVPQELPALYLVYMGEVYKATLPNLGPNGESIELTTTYHPVKMIGVTVRRIDRGHVHIRWYQMGTNDQTLKQQTGSIVLVREQGNGAFTLDVDGESQKQKDSDRRRIDEEFKRLGL